jgi:hypothetical protein
MIEEKWREFFWEHERVMLELSIGKVVPNTSQPVDFIKDLLEFANEVDAVMVCCVSRMKARVPIHDDLWNVATSLCDESVSKTELVTRLLIAFIGLHTDRVKVVRPASTSARRSLFVGRRLTGDMMVADCMEDLRREGWLNPDMLEPLIDEELSFDPVAKRRRLKPGLGKKGSRRRKDQIRRRKEREAKRAAKLGKV